MKTVIILCVIAFVLLFIAGCGPGQPFEIEGIHHPQTFTTTYVSAVK